MTADSRESRPRRDPVDSIAYALCANDESGDPDYGNDAVAQMVYDQLVSDGHLRTPTEVDHTDPAAAEIVPFGEATVGEHAYTWELPDQRTFGEYRFETSGDPHALYGEELPVIRKRWALVEVVTFPSTTTNEEADHG